MLAAVARRYLSARERRECTYGRRIGADGLLVTCSALGPTIERAAALLPVAILKPNEGVTQSAIEAGNRIAMIATFPPLLATVEGSRPRRPAGEARRRNSPRSSRQVQ